MNEASFTTVDSAYKNDNFKPGDVVRTYKEATDLEYPCIILECEKVERFRVDALRGVLEKPSTFTVSEKYHIYISMGGQLVRSSKGRLVEVGLLSPTKLRVLMTNQVFDTFNKVAYLTKDTMVTGDMIYALCQVEAQ